MTVYEIIAPQRSGHHSMMNWILLNICGSQCTWKYKMNIITDSVYQLNCANHDKIDAKNLYNDFVDKYKQLIISYEDTKWDYTLFNSDEKYRGVETLTFPKNTVHSYKRILFIRDFYNTLSSRIKSNQNKNFKTFKDNKNYHFNVNQEFINIWKSYARAIIENKVLYLKFEDWLDDKSKRNEFIFKVTGNYEIYGNKNIIGTKSSFTNDKSFNERHKQVSIPEETKELIRKDSELHYLIGALGYEYKEI